jgi:Response regulator receiver domain
MFGIFAISSGLTCTLDARVDRGSLPPRSAQRDGSGCAAVLLDQKMPGIDGLQTLVRLKERVPQVCVIMVTAFASIELAVDAMKLGATDFLRKPMTPEALRSAVAAALATRPPTSVAHAIAADRPKPPIETMTFNGFRIIRSRAATAPPIEPATREHVFRVTRAPGTPEATVTVVIDPEAEARVARLTGRRFQPGGSFWREQAESLLASYLWSEGRTPENGRLTVRDVSRDDIDLAAAWKSD